MTWTSSPGAPEIVDEAILGAAAGFVNKITTFPLSILEIIHPMILRQIQIKQEKAEKLMMDSFEDGGLKL